MRTVPSCSRAPDQCGGKRTTYRIRTAEQGIPSRPTRGEVAIGSVNRHLVDSPACIVLDPIFCWLARYSAPHPRTSSRLVARGCGCSCGLFLDQPGWVRRGEDPMRRGDAASRIR